MTWMTRRRLEWSLRARGPDLASWPEHERREAVCLLRHCPAARQALADALAQEDAPEPDEMSLCRMQLALRRRVAPRPALVRGMRWSALAACAAAGLYLGGTAVQTSDPTPDLFSSAQTVSFAALDQ